MKDLFTLWKHTRMVVLVALTAAVYAAILIPFKVAIPLIPGFTEVRPAIVVPIICSLMFGPAAAWGAAFGNLAGDIYGGTFGPGSAFGFVGNFLYGYIPYKLLAIRWAPLVRWLGLSLMAIGLTFFEITALLAISTWAIGGKAHLPACIGWGIAALVGLLVYARASRARPHLAGPAPPQIGEFAAVAILASAACAFVIAWGVNALRLVPFAVLGPIIFINDTAVSIILGPPLLRILYPRVRRWGLLYRDVMPSEDLASGRLTALGMALVALAVIPGLIAGTIIATSYPDLSVTLTMAPLVVLALIGFALL